MTIDMVVCPSCDGSGAGSAVIRVRGGLGGAVGLSGGGGGCGDCRMTGEVTREKRARLLRGRYDRANLAAEFSPQFVDRADGETIARPCLTVAGVQGYVYVDEDGVLVVSMHFDTADMVLFDRGPAVPLRFVLGDGDAAYEVDAHGRDITPSRRRCAWCNGPMVGKRADARTCKALCRVALSRYEQRRG